MFAKNQAELVPVALKEWGTWYGTDDVKQETRSAEESIGGGVAASTRRNYEGRFKNGRYFGARKGWARIWNTQ